MVQPPVRLYDAKNLHAIDWPHTPDGEFAKRYLTPLIQQGTKHFIENIEVELFVLRIDNFALPVVAGNSRITNAYVCSPYAHYVGYALQNMHRIENQTLRSVIKPLMTGFGSWLRAGEGIDQIVFINNWLLSADLYPSGLTPAVVAQIIDFIRGRFPQHAIGFRSIDPIINPELYKYLECRKFDMIANRQIYIADTTNEAIFQRRILKSDLKLLKEMPYEIATENEIGQDELERLLTLYREVYIDKYSNLNPLFNLNFIKHILNNKLIGIRALKKEGRIEGVFGFLVRRNVLMCPFFGFNKESPDHAVLYRLLCTLLIVEARQKGMIFNALAGASSFKKIRYPQSCMEKLAISSSHLPFSAQLRWKVLKNYANRIVAGYMINY